MHRGAVTARHDRLWEYTLAHVVCIILCRVENHFSKLCVLLNKRRHERVEEPENIVTHQHLAITMRPSSNADCRNSQLGSYCLGHRIWNCFKDDRKCPGIFESARIEDQFLRCFVVSGLLLHPSKLMHILRSQSEMPHNGKTRHC